MNKRITLLATQDRKTVLNFEHISSLELKEIKNLGKERAQIECTIPSGERIVLASYDSIKRGNEIYGKLIDFLVSQSKNESISPIFEFEKF